MGKTSYLASRPADRQAFTIFLLFAGQSLWAIMVCMVGLTGGCTATSGVPVVASAAAPVAPAYGRTMGAATVKAAAEASFEKFLANINAVNGAIAKDNGSPAQQQLLLDASGAALAGAVAATSEGANTTADVAALAGAVKAINDVALLPSVQSTNSAQVKQVIMAATGTANNANALASKAALIYDAATAKGATPQSALLVISQGYTQAQAQAATAAVVVH